MKAALYKQCGPPESLSIEEVESPKAGKEQAIFSVKACGVNFPDTLIIRGKYQFQPAMPFSSGGEVAGIVKEVGKGVHHVKAGDKVIAFTGWGGFAEEEVADAKTLIPIPEGMDFITAASFVMTFGTSHYALKDRGIFNQQTSMAQQTLVCLLGQFDKRFSQRSSTILVLSHDALTERQGLPRPR